MTQYIFNNTDSHKAVPLLWFQYNAFNYVLVQNKRASKLIPLHVRIHRCYFLSI